MSTHTCPCQDTSSTQYLLSIPKGLSDNLSNNLSDAQLAARAILRKDAHCDKHHFEGTETSCLHPLTVAFYKTAEQGSNDAENCAALVENTFKDVLDTLTILDRLDGGFSLLIRCPGIIPTKERVMMDTDIVRAYVPLHELGENKEYDRHLTYLMKLFTETIASQHRHNLQQRAANSNISLLVPEAKEDQSNTYPNIFPTPLKPGSACFLFTLMHHEQASDTEETSFTDSNTSEFWAEACRLAALCQPVENAEEGALVEPAMGEPEHRMVANAASVTETRGGAGLGNNQQSGMARLRAIISIGPRTDAVLDELGINDQVIPRLHLLIRSTRSSRWVSEMQQNGWGLKRADAIRLVDAILADVGSPVIITVSSNTMTRFTLFFSLVSTILLLALFLA